MKNALTETTQDSNVVQRGPNIFPEKDYTCELPWGRRCHDWFGLSCAARVRFVAYGKKLNLKFELATTRGNADLLMSPLTATTYRLRECSLLILKLERVVPQP